MRSSSGFMPSFEPGATRDSAARSLLGRGPNRRLHFVKSFAGAVGWATGFRLFPWLAFLLLAIGAPRVFAQPAAPTITTQPQNLTLNPGSSGTLTVTASGTGTLSYRWFKNGTALTDGSGLAGTLTATLSFTLAQSGFSGSYSVIVSNSGGSVTSTASTLTVAIILPPVITSANSILAPPSVPFTYAITATNSPISFGATGLPTGLALDAVTGVISGTPTTSGSYSVVLLATNNNGTGTRSITITTLPSYADRLLVYAPGAPPPLFTPLPSTALSAPANCTVDSIGNVFVADAGNHTITKITSANEVTIFAGSSGQGGGADGAGTAATFLAPSGIAIDSLGNLYVADTGNHTIRKITPMGVVTTLAGSIGAGGNADGTGSTARFFSPQGIAIDLTGKIYIADTGNHTIRTITSTGVVTTLAGAPGASGLVDGLGNIARFNAPNSLAFDSAGSLYVADTANDRLRKISPAGMVDTLEAAIHHPNGIAVDKAGNIFVASGRTSTIGPPSIPNGPPSIINVPGGIWEITASGALRNIVFSPAYLLPSARPVVSANFTETTQITSPVGMACDAGGAFYWMQGGLHKAAPFFPITLVSKPADQTAVTGSSVRFDVAASGQPLSYAWWGVAFPYRDGTGVPAIGYLDSTSASQNVVAQISPRSPDSYWTNAGEFGVIVYNAGSFAFASAQLTVLPAPPAILTQPVSQTVFAGQRVTFSVSASSVNFSGSTFTYVWRFNGAPIPGATDSTFNIASAQASNVGNYSVTVTERSIAGTNSISSSVATLVVNSPVAPQITTAPQPVALRAGGSTTLSVAATGTPAPIYQWNFNGVPIAGATSSTLTLSNTQLAGAGSYTVTISNLGGSITSAPVAVDVITTRLINLSARGPVGGGNILIVGFVTNGSTSKQLLVRGIGPTLAAFGVGNALSTPQLTLFDSKPSVLGANGGWGGAAALTDAFVQVGAFALPTNSADSALLRNLSAGLYSAQLSGVGSAAGIGLAEIYDADSGTPAPRLVNLSASGFVGTGGNVLIAGFVIAGNRPAKILVRAVGPTLGLFGVSGALATPQLALFDFAGKTVATNTGWGGDSALSSAFTQVGAFALPLSSNDSALLASLPPGSYTALVSGIAGATGVALVEVYEVP